MKHPVTLFRLFGRYLAFGIRLNETEADSLIQGLGIDHVAGAIKPEHLKAKRRACKIASTISLLPTPCLRYAGRTYRRFSSPINSSDVFRQIHPISWVSACATSSSPRGGTYLPRSVMSVSCKARMSRRIPKYSAFRSLAQERYSQNKSCSCCLCSSGSIGTIASLLLPSTAG